MNNLPMLTDVVEYSLYHESQDPIIIEEPIGWQDDLVELKRSSKNFTTVTKYSTNLEFIKEGAEFIKTIYDLYGFEAKIVLTKRQVHPTEQEVQVRYTAILDGYSFQLSNNKVKVNAVESDLTSKINGYKSEKIELTRDIAMNGTQLNPLVPVDVSLDGKQLQLVSKWEEDLEYSPYKIPLTTTGNELREYCTFHMNQIANSDDQTFSVTNPRLNSLSNQEPASGSTGNMWYAIALEDKELDVDMDFFFTIKQGRFQSMANNNSRLVLIRFYDDSVNGNSQYRYKSIEQLAYEDSVVGIDPVDGKEFKTLQFKERRKINISKGESLAFAIDSFSIDGESVDVTYDRVRLTIIEDSLVEKSDAKAYLIHDVIDHMLKVFTGSQTTQVYSEYFGRTDLGYQQDGEGAYMAIASGFMIRQFNDKPLSTNWNDLMESLFCALNVSYSIEKDGFKEYVRVEPMEFFFSEKRYVFENKVRAKDVKITVNDTFSISGIKLGYNDGGAEYEEAVGLDEYNGQVNWLTPLSRAQTEYTRVSPYRADSTGIEFARRKPQFNFPTEDTDYDEDVFFLDLKDVGDPKLVLRKWQDDFPAIPENVYNPDTAYNLRFAPTQMLKRHGFMIRSGLYAYPNDLIRFGSAIGNADLLLDGIRTNQEGIIISELDREKFRNIWIEFDYDTSYEVEQEVINNIYGIFEFSNDRGVTYQFRLFDFKKNKYKGLLINGIQ